MGSCVTSERLIKLKKATFVTDNCVDMPGIHNQDEYSKFLRFALKYADSFCLSVYTNDKMNDLEDFKCSKWGCLILLYS